MLLRGEKVTLRPVELDDIRYIFKWRNDHEAAGEYGNFQPLDWFALEKEVKEWSTSPFKFSTFIIEKNDDRTRIGTIVHHLYHPISSSIEIGYRIGESNER